MYSVDQTQNPSLCCSVHGLVLDIYVQCELDIETVFMLFSPWIGIKYLCIVWTRHRIRPYVAQSMDWYYTSMYSVNQTQKPSFCCLVHGLVLNIYVQCELDIEFVPCCSVHGLVLDIYVQCRIYIEYVPIVLSPWIGNGYLRVVQNIHRIRPYSAQSMDWYWISMCSVEYTQNTSLFCSVHGLELDIYVQCRILEYTQNTSLLCSVHGLVLDIYVQCRIYIESVPIVLSPQIGIGYLCVVQNRQLTGNILVLSHYYITHLQF